MVGKSVVMAALFISVAFAGCASGPDEELIDFENIDSTELAVGKGALTGVLFDDRYRPLQLVEEGEAQSEFQFEGFILVQETGDQLRTTENGEFGLLDLEPGKYTLRTTLDGHEAAPTRVTVEEGEFAEASITARRKVIEDGVAIVEEYMVFIPCTIGYVIQSLISNCQTDFSGDNSRFAVPRDFTIYENVTYLVGEVKAKEEDSYTFQIRDEPGNIRWAVHEFIGTYSKMVLEKGVKNTVHDDQERNVPWNNTEVTEFLLFPGAPFEEEISSALAPACNQAADDALTTFDDSFPDETFPLVYAPVPRTCEGHQGIGVGLAYEARLIMSIILGEPSVPVEEYCVICE